eukprot:g11915.t1
MNQASSRSHSIFQIVVEQKRRSEQLGERVLRSKLNLVDLAGSEKWDVKQDMEEVRCLDETISTLRFADRAKQVMAFVRVNEHRPVDEALVQRLQAEVKHLKEMLHNATADTGLHKKTPDSPPRPAALTALAEAQLLGYQETIEQLRRENIMLRENLTPKAKDVAEKVDQEQRGLDLVTLHAANRALEEAIEHIVVNVRRFFRFDIEEEDLRVTSERDAKSEKLAYRLRGKHADEVVVVMRKEVTEEDEERQLRKELKLAKERMKKNLQLQEWLLQKEQREIEMLANESEKRNKMDRDRRRKDEEFRRRAAKQKAKLKRFYEAAQMEARKEAEQRDRELLSGRNHATSLSSPDGSKEAETVAG